MVNPKRRTILLYGRTNAGKTALVGELAEHVKKTLNKRTRLYTADRGGVKTIQPYIDLGVIEAVEMGDSNPWVFLNKAVRGCVKDANGKWIPGKNDDIGLFAFESIRAIAESLMQWMSTKSTEGLDIGGGGNVSFKVVADGETLKVGGSNKAHYGVAQSRMTEEIWESQRLPGEYLIWTSSVSKDEDTTSSSKVLGPDAIGKALTPEMPRWFDYTMRADVYGATAGTPERHLLFIGSHQDILSGGATGLGNMRMPLDAKPPEKPIIEPASIVTALARLEGGRETATEAIRKRLGL